MKRFGKYSQVAELIFTTCPTYAYVGIDMCRLVSFHSKKLRAPFVGHKLPKTCFSELENERRGGVVLQQQEGKRPRRPKWLSEALLIPIKKCNTAIVQKEISIINTKFGLV